MQGGMISKGRLNENLFPVEGLSKGLLAFFCLRASKRAAQAARPFYSRFMVAVFNIFLSNPFPLLENNLQFTAFRSRLLFVVFRLENPWQFSCGKSIPDFLNPNLVVSPLTELTSAIISRSVSLL
jgi:hypothetical protein